MFCQMMKYFCFRNLREGAQMFTVFGNLPAKNDTSLPLWRRPKGSLERVE